MFSCYSGAGFKLRACSTWLVIYSFGLTMIQFFSILGENMLFTLRFFLFGCCTRLFFLRLFLISWGCYILGAVFVFDLVEDQRQLFTLFAPSFLLIPWEGRGREASVNFQCSLAVVFGFVCLAAWWSGPFEQCVGDFCSVPRVGVKRKKTVKVQLSSVSRHFS